MSRVPGEQERERFNRLLDERHPQQTRRLWGANGGW